MGLKTKKAGTSFGKTNTAKPEEIFAGLIKKAAEEVGLKVETSLIARGLGTIAAEGGFVKGINWTSNSAHQGPWALSDGFEGCSGNQRLDPWLSTLAAMRYVKKHGGNTDSGFGAWWPFEESQGEAEGGKKRAGKYIGIAERAIEGDTSGEEGLLGAAEGIVGAAGDAVGAVVSAEQFLQEALETLLNFEKLGTLAVHAFAWFLRLLAKAIWDYVIAPVVHWTERAVEWYWTNFFSTGTEKGSGFGYQIRNNAGIITIIFWGIGYAVLWTDGSGATTPVASHNSMLGQTVKGAVGQVARRNLTKPKDVKEKTPQQPKPKKSKVLIEQVDEFSVKRNRPVKVGRPGEVATGRKQKDEQSYRVPRPGTPQKKPGHSVQTSGGEIKTKTPAKTPEGATQGTRAGTVSRTASGPRSKSSRGTG